MRNPSTSEIFSIGTIEAPYNKSLDSNYKEIPKRKFWPRLGGWTISILTLGILGPNRRLDALTKRVLKVASHALQRNELSADQKSQLAIALTHLRLIIKGNDGRNSRCIKRLIKKCRVQSAATSGVLQEIAKVKRLDRQLGRAVSGTWRHGLGAHEEPQSFEQFKLDPHLPIYKSRRHLKIRTIGEMSNSEKMLLRIVQKYLEAVHGQTVELYDDNIKADELKDQYVEMVIAEDGIPEAQKGHMRRQLQSAFQDGNAPLMRLNPRPQYNFNHLVTFVRDVWKNGDAATSTLCFTKEDLYANGLNFIYGVGMKESGVGLLSLARLGDPENPREFKDVVFRLMKIATHEFGHMRGLPHCTTHSCNMQGVNSHHERTPLTFCAEDMAKVAFLNGSSLKEAYQRQLTFFENFSQTFGISLDFSEEITHLRSRVTLL